MANTSAGPIFVSSEMPASFSKALHCSSRSGILKEHRWLSTTNNPSNGRASDLRVLEHTAVVEL